MKAKLLLAALLATLTPSCALYSNANVFSLDQERAMGTEAYNQMMAEEQNLITSGAQYQMVRGVMERLVAAARVYDPQPVEAFEWEVKLIGADDTVNAFALPGGKMAVYTGILPVAQGEAGLAVVMGHEIAHATKSHGAKAVTRANITSVGLGLLGALGGGDQNQLAALASQFGAQMVGLKFGREAELEADRTGLTYMAAAGYDPREAVGFWQRMGGGSGGGAPPEWLSTHPSHGNRIDQLQSLMPAALEVYRASGGRAPAPPPAAPAPEKGTGKRLPKY